MAHSALRRRLAQAEVVCHDCGKKYGVLSVHQSSQWMGRCHVCDTETVVTEARDYAYLITGRRALARSSE